MSEDKTDPWIDRTAIWVDDGSTTHFTHGLISVERELARVVSVNGAGVPIIETWDEASQAYVRRDVWVEKVEGNAMLLKVKAVGK